MAPKASKKGEFSEADLAAFQSAAVKAPSSNKFFFNVAAFATSLLPVFLFAFIQHVDLAGVNLVVYGLFAVVSSQLLAYAYALHADNEAAKLLPHREDALRAANKKKGADVRAEANAVANNEATFGSIFYNNALFVLLTLVFGFFLFANFSPVVNYALTAVAASGFTVLSHA